MTEAYPPSFDECAAVVRDSDASTDAAVSLLEACHAGQPDTGLLTPLFLGAVLGAWLVYVLERRGVLGAVRDHLRDDDLDDRVTDVNGEVSSDD